MVEFIIGVLVVLAGLIGAASMIFTVKVLAREADLKEENGI